MKKGIFVLSVVSLLTLVACQTNPSSRGSSATSDNGTSSSTMSSSELSSSSNQTSETTTEKATSISTTILSSESSSSSNQTSETTLFTIEITTSQHATMFSNVSKAKAGDEIILTYTLDTNCILVSVKMNNQPLSENSDHEFRFTMPEEHVVITYEAVETFGVSFTSSHATASLQGTQERFASGATVLLQIDSVDLDYSFDRFEIKDNNETTVPYVHVEGLTYSFTMPESDVTISVIAELTKYKISLPQDLPAGISMILSESGDVLPGEEVKLYVRNSVKESKRIEAVKVNGDTISGLRTNDSECTLYTFNMPKGAVVVTAEIIDVYKVSVSSELSSILGLEGNVIAASGETVNITPIFFTNNHWAKNFRAVESDVDLIVSDTVPGAYTFVMPQHTVTITADFGYIGHKIIYDTTSDLYSVEFKDSTDVYVTNEIAKFKVTPKTVDVNIDGVKVNNVALPSPDDEGYYSIQMDDKDITIEPIISYNYKEIVLAENDYFDFTLTTSIDDSVVAVDNNVLSNQTVIVTSTRNDTASTSSNMMVSGFKVYGGSSSEDCAEITVGMTNMGNGQFSFTTSTSYRYYRLEAIVEVPFTEETDMIGDYDTGFRPYYGNNYKSKIETSGDFYYSSTANSEPKTKVGTLTQDEADTRCFKTGTKYVHFNGEDSILFVDSTARGGTYLYSKGKGGISLSSSDNGAHTYSYMLIESSKMLKQFIHMECKNGDVVTVYYDYTTNQCVWNAKATVVSGTDGFTVDDKILITDADNNKLALFGLTKKDTYSNGYQHAVKEETLDDFAGTYTPLNGEQGSDNLIVTGYGIVQIGENEYFYTIDGDYLIVSINDESKYFVLDKENNTYQKSLGPTDTYEGSYTLNESTIIIDGYGNATIGEVEYTYTIKNGYLIFKDSANVETYYEVDKTNKTLTVVEEISLYAGTQYSGTYTNNEYSEKTYYKLVIDFTSSSECHITYTYGTSLSTNTNYTEFNNDGTYTVDESGNIVINTHNTNTSALIEIEFTLNSNQQLVCNEEVRVSSYGYIYEGMTLSKVN